ncbi:MAG TPA: hypothetical protein ENJ18_13665, partial [Nannocystis exedens]|nr:hypothetical protein [Nannocystis exedens]
MTNRSPSWNRSRDERWQDSLGGLGLSQTGNWLFRRLDLDGNGGFTGTGELDEIGTFNDVNELLARDIDADSTREERVYSCQNWRADVSAVLTDSGKMVEWVKYLAYGVPFALPAGDTDSDGDWDATDAAAILNSGSYDMRQDAELDG